MYNQCMKILENLRNKVIVSVQAMPSEPLYLEECMLAMMKSVIKGGASGLRVAGARDVKNAKSITNLPVIGITKPEIIPQNFKELVYITPTITDVIALSNAGADIIAFDATIRPRPDADSIKQLIKYIHIKNKLAMADISTLEEGINAKKEGADIISTTLSGYTSYTSNDCNQPSFELLEQLVEKLDCPVILEGRIWSQADVQKAFELGAHSVVIGSAITRPALITKRFVDASKKKGQDENRSGN